jgi:hypothetical protein
MVEIPRATSLALLGLELACASSNRTESPSQTGQCTVQAGADGSVHVEAHGYALRLPKGFEVDCESDPAFANIGMVSADYEQPSVGLVNVLWMVVPTAKRGDAHAALLEQFRGLDVDSFGIPADGVETVAAGPAGRELRCYGGPASGDFATSHYYACTAVERRADGVVLGSVIRVVASSEEWRVNGDASTQWIQSLSRAWTSTAAAEPEPPAQDGCAERLGVDPMALATTCGFGPLVAQNELQTYCELQYQTTAGQPGPVLTLREYRHRNADAAWSVHRAAFGETPEETIAELPGIPGSHWSSFAGYRWSYLPGWTHARRIGWFEADCAPARMMSVLQAMVEAPQPRPEPAPPWKPSPGANDSLASHYGARTDLDLENLDTRDLPTKAKTIIVTLLSAVGRNDDALARSLLSPGAGFGMPDRREFNAWPIAEGDNVSTFMAALQGVASRFPADAKFMCPPIKPEFMDGVARGEHPMWCHYMSADGFDLLVFRLIAIDGVAHVDYVGMFETAPTSANTVPVPELSMSTEPLPPLTPGSKTELPTPKR